jgi:hypothetical protein
MYFLYYGVEHHNNIEFLTLQCNNSLIITTHWPCRSMMSVAWFLLHRKNRRIGHMCIFAWPCMQPFSTSHPRHSILQLCSTELVSMVTCTIDNINRTYGHTIDTVVPRERPPSWKTTSFVRPALLGTNTHMSHTKFPLIRDHLFFNFICPWGWSLKRGTTSTL